MRVCIPPIAEACVPSAAIVRTGRRDALGTPRLVLRRGPWPPRRRGWIGGTRTFIRPLSSFCGIEAPPENTDILRDPEKEKDDEAQAGVPRSQHHPACFRSWSRSSGASFRASVDLHALWPGTACPGLCPLGAGRGASRTHERCPVRLRRLPVRGDPVPGGHAHARHGRGGPPGVRPSRCLEDQRLTARGLGLLALCRRSRTRIGPTSGRKILRSGKQRNTQRMGQAAYIGYAAAFLILL